MSERGSGRVRNTKGLDEEWTTVERGRRRRNDGKEPSNTSKNISRVSRGRDGFSIFVDNLPGFYDNLLLRKLFNKMGRIKDTYMPWRRRFKTETRFGFVNFEREDEALKAIKCFNGVAIFRFKITVKEAFGNKERRNNASSVQKKVGPSTVETRRTFAEVVARGKEVWVAKDKDKENFNSGDFLKQPEEGKFPRSSPVCFCSALEEKLNKQASLLESQEKRLREYDLMWVEIKKELVLWKNTRNGNYFEDKEQGFQESFEKEEEIDSVSRVPDSAAFLASQHGVDTNDIGVRGDEAVNDIEGRGDEVEGEKQFRKGKEDVLGHFTEEEISEGTSSCRDNQKVIGKNKHGVSKKIRKTYRSSLKFNHLGTILLSIKKIIIINKEICIRRIVWRKMALAVRF